MLLSYYFEGITAASQCAGLDAQGPWAARPPHAPPSQESRSPCSTPFHPRREGGSLEPWLTFTDLHAVARSSRGMERRQFLRREEGADPEGPGRVQGVRSFLEFPQCDVGFHAPLLYSVRFLRQAALSAGVPRSLPARPEVSIKLPCTGTRRQRAWLLGCEQFSPGSHSGWASGREKDGCARGCGNWRF